MLPILIVIAYIIGSINVAIIVCKILKLPDPRTQGSNNPGATNVLRIAGKIPALITLILDGLKGFIPVFIAQYLGLNLLDASLIAVGAFLGHVYPIFFKFKGGKGVATFLGALLALNYLTGLAFIGIWLFIAKVLKISSLSALITTALSPILLYLFTQNLSARYVIIALALWIFYTHKSNIKRMFDGTEEQINS